MLTLLRERLRNPDRDYTAERFLRAYGAAKPTGRALLRAGLGTGSEPRILLDDLDDMETLLTRVHQAGVSTEAVEEAVGASHSGIPSRAQSTTMPPTMAQVVSMSPPPATVAQSASG